MCNAFIDSAVPVPRTYVATSRLASRRTGRDACFFHGVRFEAGTEEPHWRDVGILTERLGETSAGSNDARDGEMQRLVYKASVQARMAVQVVFLLWVAGALSADVERGQSCFQRYQISGGRRGSISDGYAGGQEGSVYIDSTWQSARRLGTIDISRRRTVAGLGWGGLALRFVRSK